MSEANLALDLGTTTLAGRLLDRRGRTLAEMRRPNPQGAVGGDVIRRLEAARKGEGNRLQSLLAEGIDEVVGELLHLAGIGRDAITAAAAAGNPAICHLLRRLPVDPILFPPHRPRETSGVHLDPAGLGLDLPVPLYLFPLVSGYVGGDLVAFLFGMEEASGSRLFIDIGTNGEMALFSGGRWLVTSVAAGPAFEGGEISCGMTVSPGAVKGVELRGDLFELQVLGGGPPRGICGSGLASAIAAALEGGLLDRRGTIVDPLMVETNLSRHVTESASGRRLSLYRDAAGEVFLTQEDVRNFQLAKGAVRAGVDCLLRRAGLSAGCLDEVVITGAFGFSLDPQTLKRVALLPPDVVDRVRFVSAGALAGVGRLLIEPDGREKAERLAASLQPFPLSGTPAFEKAFLSALEF